jgi:hypothetical protein
MITVPKLKEITPNAFSNCRLCVWLPFVVMYEVFASVISDIFCPSIATEPNKSLSEINESYHNYSIDRDTCFISKL